MYALLYWLAQATVGERRGGANPSARLWQMMGGGESRGSKVRGWLLGSVALPGAVGVANRLGLGPVRADLSSGAIGRAGFEAMAEVVRDLRIEAEHVIFGHTHRRGGPERAARAGALEHRQLGPLPGPARRDRGGEPLLARDRCACVDDEGEPELCHLLDDLAREQLAGGETDD